METTTGLLGQKIIYDPCRLQSLRGWEGGKRSFILEEMANPDSRPVCVMNDEIAYFGDLRRFDTMSMGAQSTLLCICRSSAVLWLAAIVLASVLEAFDFRAAKNWTTMRDWGIMRIS